MSLVAEGKSVVSSPDGRRLRSAASRLEILNAAEVEFASRGFAQTSIRSVALAVGMSAPGVARHFPDKEALFAAILQRIQERNLDVLNATTVELTLPERLSLMVARLKTRRTETTLYTMLLGEGRRSTHAAHSYLTGLITGVGGMLADSFHGEAPAIHAGWEGLRLLWLYLPDRVDPHESVDSRLAQHPTGAGSREPAPLERLAASPAPPQPARAPADHLRGAGLDDRIIAEAARAFAEHGYRGARIRSIAAAVGISHTTLMYHFATKEALLQGVLGSGEAEQPGLDGLDFLRALYERTFSGAGWGELARVRSALAFEAIDPEHPAHAYFVRRFTRLLDRVESVYERLAAAGQLAPGLDPRLEAIWTVALWEGLRIQSFYRSGVDEPEVVRRELNRALVPSIRLERVEG